VSLIDREIYAAASPQTGDLQGIYASSGVTVETSPLLEGRFSYKIAHDGVSARRIQLGKWGSNGVQDSHISACSEVVLGAWVYFDTALSSGSEAILVVANNGLPPKVMGEVRIDSDRKLHFYDNNGATQKATGTTQLSLDTWYRLEFRISKETGTNNGEYELRIQTETGEMWVEWSGSDGNTASDSCYRVYFGSYIRRGGSFTTYWANLTVSDTFLGRVYARLMDAYDDGNYTDWNNGDSTDVDDFASSPYTQDGDSSYWDTTGNGRKQTAALESAASAGIASDAHVWAVLSLIYAKEHSGSGYEICVLTRIDDINGDAQTDFDEPGVSYEIRATIYNSTDSFGNPSETAWEVADLDDLEIGANTDSFSPGDNLRLTAVAAIVFFSPGQTIEPDAIESSLEMGEPIVTVEAGDQTIYPAALASGLSMGSPSMGLRIAPTALSSGLSIGTPALRLILRPSGLASGLSVGSPSLELRIYPSALSSALAVGSPLVFEGEVPVDIFQQILEVSRIPQATHAVTQDPQATLSVDRDPQQTVSVDLEVQEELEVDRVVQEEFEQ